MDFFAAQDRARRKTWQLIALFAIAIVGLIVATNVLVAVVVAFSTTPGIEYGVGETLNDQPAQTWLVISGGVLICVAGASLYKYFALRSGGRAIVEMLGGRLIDPGTQLLAERRLLNVVEEMAIAAGIRVPAVYRIDEPGINAFAAGFGTDDAVIGVTAGTLESLNREELQGVIGHEFSHVLNGDSRLNLRLIALLNGILFIGLVGRLLLHGAARSGGGRRNSGALPLVLLGVGLIVIGFAGTFCGNLIKAAVSRQREYLADAASVQFTRNPHGIANALRKIGGAASGSTLASARAAEMSHMFFGQAVHLFMNGLMATHPPLPLRIRAIEPGWDGTFLAGAAAAELEAAPGVAGFAAGTSKRQPSDVAATAGNPTAASLTEAQTLIGGLPQRCVDAAHDPWSARALICALLLPGDHAAHSGRADLLEPQVLQHLPQFETALVGLDDLQRLTIVSLAVPALLTLSRPQYDRFVADVIALIRADHRIELFEWVLHRVLLKSLKPHFEGAARLPVRHHSLDALQTHVAQVLSAIARAGSSEIAARQRAFAVGAAAMGKQLQFDGTDDANFARLNNALRELRTLHPLEMPKLIKGCAACALTDGATTSERALLIGIAATLDCPLPPDLAV